MKVLRRYRARPLCPLEDGSLLPHSAAVCCQRINLFVISLSLCLILVCRSITIFYDLDCKVFCCSKYQLSRAMVVNCYD